MPVIKSRWAEVGNGEPYICSSRTSIGSKLSKSGIDQHNVSHLCRLSREKSETITCMVSSYSEVARKQHRKKPNKLGKKYIGIRYSIRSKELEKIAKYHDLRLQAQKLLNAKPTVIPTVFCTLGAVNEKLGNHLKNIGMPTAISWLQNAALLWTGFHFRKVLDC